jgi:hypothetical protein
MALFGCAQPGIRKFSRADISGLQNPIAGRQEGSCGHSKFYTRARGKISTGGICEPAFRQEGTAPPKEDGADA